jgi:hypothetical protein
VIRRSVPPAQASPSASSSPPDCNAPIEGHVYCAARNVQHLARLAPSAADADHLLCALANLECIARATGSPARDIGEIEAWRIEAERRLQSLRGPRASMHITSGIMEQRRVPA